MRRLSDLFVRKGVPAHGIPVPISVSDVPRTRGEYITHNPPAGARS
jgi:hypothetical protein